MAIMTPVAEQDKERMAGLLAAPFVVAAVSARCS
jgi:hypothetical protein